MKTAVDHPTRVLLAVLVLLAITLPLRAQTSRGTVTGIVSDPSGAMVAGAQVDLTNRATNVKRSTTTNEAGLFRFDAVDLGDYDLAVRSAGFSTFVKRAIPVLANQTTGIDVPLEVGETTSIVEVVARAEAVLQTQAPVRGGNWDSTTISEVALPFRNPAALTLSLPGVSSNRYGFGVSTFVVNGARGRSNNFLIDGTENNDISVAGQAMQIRNPDAVAEVSAQTSNYDAEFGRAGGGVVNVITRSGTNDLHGTLHYLLDVTNDDALTNTQSLLPAIRERGKPLPGTEQWYGGTVGGPIARNRTFFFFSFQDQRQASSSTQTLTTLTAQGRETLNRLYPRGRNPRVDLYNEVTGTANATSRFFNVGLGDGRPDLQFGDAVQPYAQKYLDRQYLGRIDHKINDHNQLSGRYVISDQNAPVGGATDFFPGFSTSQVNRYQNAAIAYTRVFSPTLTNELRLPYNRITLSFPIDTANALGQTMARHTIAGGITAIGVQTNLPQGRVANNYILQDTVTRIRGAHTLRGGFDILVQRSRQFAPIRERGELTFNATSAYSGFANFIDDFGGSGGGVQRDFGSPAYYPKLTRHAYFFQDRWRVSKRLTLTLGGRYEYFGLPMNSLFKPAFSGLFNIDPVTFDGPFRLPNKVKADKNNWSPAVGINYALTDRMVIRTGYQIGYDSFFNNIASNAAVATPNVIATTVPSVVTTAEPRGLDRLSARLPVAARDPSALDSQTLMLENLVNPYYQRWSFGIQRELPGNILAEVSYVGSHGVRLFANEDLNPVVPAALRILPVTTPPIPASRQQPRLDALQGPRLTRTNGGSSNYHSMQLNVNRRFSKGFSVVGAYTLSKMIDNASEIFGVGQTNSPQNTQLPSIFGGLKNDRSLSFFDRTHRLVLTYVYELPFMKEQAGLLGRIIGGWQLSGVTTFETGVPLNVYNGLDADGLGGNFDRPNYNPNGQPGVRAVPRATSPTGYVNPDEANAPIDPARAMYIGLPAHTGNVPLPSGDLGRNTLRTPGVNNFDASIHKTLRATERLRFQFRGEFYNIFNHPQYGTPSISPFSPGQQGISANVNTSPAGRFLQPQFADGGGRVIRYQLKLIF